MSEFSAKHKALNILRVLTAEKDSGTKNRPRRTGSPQRRHQSHSPRSDLTSSQEILAGKYRELAALLGTQHVERKTVSRLQTVDLVSNRTVENTSRMWRSHDNSGKLPRRRQGRNQMSSPSDCNPETELSPCLTKSRSEKYSTQSDASIDLKQSHSIKRVVFSDVMLRPWTDESSTDISDTEVIRRILCSPRKAKVGEMRPSSTAGGQGQTTFKKKRRKAKSSLNPITLETKSSLKGTPVKTKLSAKQETFGTKSSPRRTTGSENAKRTSLPDENRKPKQHYHSSDNKLSTSGNPDVLSWLKDKNKISRKQRRSERKKEQKDIQAEQRVTEEKIRRLNESNEKVSEWMKYKQDEMVLRQRVEKSVQRNLKQREEHLDQIADKKSKKLDSGKIHFKRKSQKAKQSGVQGKEFSGKPASAEDEATRHHLIRNLKADQLHDEEKRQKKDAEKRRKRLLREAKSGEEATHTDSRPSMSGPQKAAPKELQEMSKVNVKTEDKQKTRPSSNPFKGLTYDQWLKEKQSDQRKRAKEDKKKEVCDPELDDLIPLLARWRIEQIKVRATRVDSGLRRSGSPQISEMDNNPAPKEARPYTWNSKTISASDAPNSGRTSTKINKSNKQDSDSSDTMNKKTKLAMPDLVSFERPEPQGCEGTKSNQSNETKSSVGQSESSRNKVEYTSSNQHAQSEQKELSIKTNGLSQPDTIFMTEPTSK